MTLDFLAIEADDGYTYYYDPADVEDADDDGQATADAYVYVEEEPADAGATGEEAPVHLPVIGACPRSVISLTLPTPPEKMTSNRPITRQSSEPFPASPVPPADLAHPLLPLQVLLLLSSRARGLASKRPIIHLHLVHNQISL